MSSPHEPLLLGPGDLLADCGDALFVFVADVEVALRRAEHDAGQQNPFDDEVRRAEQQLAVLERARLAFVGVADDVLSLADRLAHLAPLFERLPAGAAHAEQHGVLQRRLNDPVALCVARPRCRGRIAAITLRTA